MLADFGYPVRALWISSSQYNLCYLAFQFCLALSVHDAGYSRCTLNLIYTFVLLSLGWCLCWWTESIISSVVPDTVIVCQIYHYLVDREYHQLSSQCSDTDIVCQDREYHQLSSQSSDTDIVCQYREYHQLSRRSSDTDIVCQDWEYHQHSSLWHVTLFVRYIIIDIKFTVPK